MLFDVDREGAALAWEDANLPAPAWAAVNRENGVNAARNFPSGEYYSGSDKRACASGLRAVCACPCSRACQASANPIPAGIEGAYREALQADRGYSGLSTKNPKHPLWRVLYGPQKLWELGELAEYGHVEKYIPRHAKQPEEVGLGRNCITLPDLGIRKIAGRSKESASQLRTIGFANQSTDTQQEAPDGQLNGAVLPDR